MPRARGRLFRFYHLVIHNAGIKRHIFCCTIGEYNWKSIAILHHVSWDVVKVPPPSIFVTCPCQPTCYRRVHPNFLIYDEFELIPNKKHPHYLSPLYVPTPPSALPWMCQCCANRNWLICTHKCAAHFPYIMGALSHGYAPLD